MSTTSTTPSPLRVGICGSGIARFHIQGYQRSPGVEVAAIAGPDVERCQAVADEYGVPHVFADYHDMLALGLDAVSVVVPNLYHTQITLDALAAGCHVLCEKPLAATVADGERMIAAARERGRILMVAFNRRYLGNVLVLKDIIDAGTLGPIYHAKAGWTRRAGIPGFGGWFTSKALAGGGPLIDLGVHVLDLALHLMGYPQAVSVSGVTHAEFGPRARGTGDYARPLHGVSTPTFDVEDFASGLVRFANGASLVVEASWAGYQELADDIYVQLYGREGGARISMPDYRYDDSLRVYTEVGGQLATVAPALPAHERWDEFAAETAEFVNCIRNNAPPPSSAEQGLTVLRIIDALYRSAESGRQVDL